MASPPRAPRRLALLLLSALAACADDSAGDLLRLPPGFPQPLLPADNPLTAAKVALGRRLFYDPRLSGNGTQSCASCHRQELAFTDGKARAVGSTEEVHPRGSMALFNVVYAYPLTWGNPLVRTLEEQALLPMFGQRPVELGLAGREGELFARLGADERYGVLFREANPADPAPVNLANLTAALASFERTLISGRSPYDRFTYQGQLDALSPAARRGMELFFSEKLECFHCHGGFNFSDGTRWEGQRPQAPVLHNTGLYNVDGQGSYPAGNQGAFEVTHQPSDRGAFRAPSLRNIAVTAPYMHDGSVATLAEVLDGHYARGGRLLREGPDAGDGAKSPLKSALVRPFDLPPAERDDVIEFLRSLTDEELLHDERLGPPADLPVLR